MSGAKNEAANEQFRNHMWPISLLFHDKLIRSTVLDYFCTCNCVKKQQRKTTREAAKKEKENAADKIENLAKPDRNPQKHSETPKAWKIKKEKRKRKNNGWTQNSLLMEKNSFRRSSTSNKADKGEHSEDARIDFFCLHINPKRPLEGVLHEVHFHWPTKHEEESPKGKKKKKKKEEKPNKYMNGIFLTSGRTEIIFHTSSLGYCSLAPQPWTK